MNDLNPSPSGGKLVRNGCIHQARDQRSHKAHIVPSPPIPESLSHGQALPGILSEWCPLVPIWEAKQRDGTEQTLLLLLLTPEQVLPLEGTGEEMSPGARG